ncbi:hypothetical protein [Vibrio porteresiae]|uniref:Uncharacterized protein n=1 Tax=Vibrio porteresiae DSM 19223 TaxID=1123496 RepID=A0ABZ0QJ86_9VIBR|nr:hypothetical protein [Vibrio porteresiae]WPC76573.1 hypothetical protein R8Z52_18765 [Vibrio porteresiae DSM 19223]
MSTQNITLPDDEIPLLDRLNTTELDKTLDEFINAVNDQYISIKSDSSHIIFNEIIKTDELNQNLRDKIFITNYDIEALKSERVVLFDKPYLVSNIYCTPNYNNNKSNLIRLLTSRFTDKKMITLDHHQNYSQEDIINSVYIANEIVMGFILPTGSTFNSLDCIDLEQLYTNDKKLSEISKAQNDIYFATHELKKNIKSQLSCKPPLISYTHN